MIQVDYSSVNVARILIVDSAERSRNILQTTLEAHNYKVDTVENGNEAIAKTQQTTYNLMLINLDLSDMPGTKLLTQIYDAIPKIRKILLADQTTLQNAQSALNQGADAYLLTPIDEEKLLTAVEEQIKKQDPKFSRQNNTGVNVLFVGAHPDDIELGCGGTLIRHIQNDDNTYALIFTNWRKRNG